VRKRTFCITNFVRDAWSGNPSIHFGALGGVETMGVETMVFYLKT